MHANQSELRQVQRFVTWCPCWHAPGTTAICGRQPIPGIPISNMTYLKYACVLLYVAVHVWALICLNAFPLIWILANVQLIAVVFVLIVLHALSFFSCPCMVLPGCTKRSRCFPGLHSNSAVLAKSRFPGLHSNSFPWASFQINPASSDLHSNSCQRFFY